MGRGFREGSTDTIEGVRAASLEVPMLTCTSQPSNELAKPSIIATTLPAAWNRGGDFQKAGVFSTDRTTLKGSQYIAFENVDLRVRHHMPPGRFSFLVCVISPLKVFTTLQDFDFRRYIRTLTNRPPKAVPVTFSWPHI